MSDFEKVIKDVEEALATGREPEEVQSERHARERAAISRDQVFRPGWLQRQVARSAALAARIPKALGGTGPRFLDRPASHAVAHVEGEPCACYPDRSDTGSNSSEGETTR